MLPNLKEQSKPIISTPATEIPTDQRKDFYYIVAGGFTLSGCSGFVNSVSMLSTFSMTVSHNTGITSKFGMALSRFDLTNSFYLGFILVAYVLGAIFVGSLIKKERFYYSMKYGILMIFEAVLIAIAAYLYSQNIQFGVYLVSFAMGLQNSLFTNFSGAVVRTTHVTGLLTDVGLLLGHWIRFRERPKEFWRMKVFMPLLTGFITGSFLAGWCFQLFGINAMYIPCLFLSSVGVIWTLARLKWQKTAGFNKHDI